MSVAHARFEGFETHLLEAVSNRGPGESVLVAFRRFLFGTGGLLAQVEAGDPDALDRLRTVNQMIADSPALLAREHRAIARYTESLAALLAEEARQSGTGQDDEAYVKARTAANAMMGVHRTLIDYVRRRVLDGDDAAGLYADVRRLADVAFALLETGLGEYAARPAR